MKQSVLPHVFFAVEGQKKCLNGQRHRKQQAYRNLHEADHSGRYGIEKKDILQNNRKDAQGKDDKIGLVETPDPSVSIRQYDGET